MADKLYGLADLKAHTTDKSCWLLVHGKVYDVTDFLEEHPGGYDIILTSTGKDATRDFEEIGHSNSAKKLLEKYLIGKYEGGDSVPAAETKPKAAAGGAAAVAVAAPKSAAMRTFHVLLPIAFLLIALALNFYASSKK